MSSGAARGPLVGARFDLIDHDGRRVTNATYHGKFPLIFFGFTHCKVVCPRALTRLTAVLDGLGERAELLEPLYITVDPERDTPGRMKQFLAANFPRFTGLTGSEVELSAAREEFRVFARRQRDPEGIEEYVVPHSAITYLLDRSGVFLTHFTDVIETPELVRRLDAVLADA
ncbi:SCO family protein [Pseudonocardia spinosispora]|uniref:SCO family protein n=1 Tax=Pseudonocardia spinosispora TaxID=103441 RepID=UPI0007E8DD83|nr:SCO family protein [Pseudonocardia spinosispora]